MFGMGSRAPHPYSGKVLYQIYPRSFQDSDGDGVGDLRGIIERLDYLAGTPDSLGVDIIWLSPFYPSPMADFGYDVSNYMDVDPLFGTLNDFKKLLYEAHRRGLEVIVDFIPNHTSNEHPWFVESRSSRTNTKRDWYVWRDAKANGSPPNNWLSVFGGSAWQFDDTTGQYYLHSFLDKQPDLNWDNPEVRHAMKAQMQFWVDLGVDGFRVDAVSWISKDVEFRDEPPNPDYRPGVDDPNHALLHTRSEAGPKLYKYLKEMASVLEEKGTGIMITEAYPQEWDDIDIYRDFYQHVNPAYSAPFNFTGIFSPWTAGSFRGVIDDFQRSVEPEDLPIYCLGNHDKPRLASRIGTKQSKIAAMLLLTLPGMPTIYYGDELGMQDVPIRPDQVQDPFEKNVPGKGLGRDPGRTPMAWENTKLGGFTQNNQPWLPLGDLKQTPPVAAQAEQPLSHLNLYKRLLAYRKHHEALRIGTYKSIGAPPDIFSFVRETENERLLVLLNYSAKEVAVPVEVYPEVQISTHADLPLYLGGSLHLRPHEGVIVRPSGQQG